MRKDFGPQTWLYPLPVLIVGTYDENGTADALNAAWGGIYGRNKIILSLSAGHKTTKNIKLKGAFTVSVADAKHVVEADYVGLVSGNNEPDKLQKAGLTITKSNFVDAPIISEFPLTLECKLEKFNEDGNIIGEIININADESILDANGAVDPAKLEAISFDPVHSAYLKLGEKVGNAFSDGKAIK